MRPADCFLDCYWVRADQKLAEFILRTNYPSRRIIRLRRIPVSSINSVLRRIMEQNSSRLEDINRK